jgi:hypothetical protein
MTFRRALKQDHLKRGSLKHHTAAVHSGVSSTSGRSDLLFCSTCRATAGFRLPAYCNRGLNRIQALQNSFGLIRMGNLLTIKRFA